jgi:hypothetical protein
MQTNGQILKMAGLLPDVSLEQCNMAAASSDVFTPFCGTPTQPDPEIISSEPDKVIDLLGLDDPRCSRAEQLEFGQDLINMHNRMGSGSWPVGCHDDIPETYLAHHGRHTMTYYVERDSFASHHKQTVSDFSEIKIPHTLSPGSKLDCALKLCVETYRPANCALLEVTDRQSADVIIIGKRIPGSTIGFAYFNDGTCHDVVTCNIDNDYRTDLVGLTRLLAHELGHNNNLQHTFSNQNSHRGIMSYRGTTSYYGFSTGRSTTLPRDPAWKQLVSFYGEGMIPLANDRPEPEPVPESGKVGEIIFNDGRRYEVHGSDSDPGGVWS